MADPIHVYILQKNKFINLTFAPLRYGETTQHQENKLFPLKFTAVVTQGSVQ